MEDKEIIEYLWQRLESGIEEVKGKYHRLCMKISNNITMNTLDAEECVSDSYLKLWNAIPPSRPNCLKTFLLRIVKNTSIDKLRKKKVRIEGSELMLVYEELSGCIADDKDISNSYELRYIINKFLEGLDTDNRRIFMKRYWYTLSIAEIAKKEDLKESTVKMRLMRMRERLKVELEKKGELL